MAEAKKDEIGIIMLKAVRLSFADTLFVAEAGDRRKKGKHAGKIPFRNSINLLLPDKDSAEGKAMEKAIKAKMVEARDAQWPTDPPKIKGEKLAMRDGDEEEWAGYAGRYYVSASRTSYGPKDGEESQRPKRPFRIIGPRKVRQSDGAMRFPDVEEGERDAPYSGCYVNAKVRFWAQDDEEYGKRINCSIEAVQFAKDGEAFGGGARTNVDDEFEDEEGDGLDDDDLDVGGGSSKKDDDDDGLGI